MDDNLFFRKSRTKKENKQDDMDVVDELDDMDEKGEIFCRPDFRHGRKNEKYISSCFYYQDRDKISCELQESFLILDLRKKCPLNVQRFSI